MQVPKMAANGHSKPKLAIANGDRVGLTQAAVLHEDTDSYMFSSSSTSKATMSSDRDHINIYIIFVFILELLVLIFVSVLEYFLRATDVFPVRQLNFSCVDSTISYSRGSSTYSQFTYNADISYAVVIALSFAIPPVVILVCEVAGWAIGDERQKTIHALCRQCQVPQVIRRILRFTGTFIFGILVTMIFTDVTKIFTGRLRPTFLEICNPNLAICKNESAYGFDSSICLEANKDKIRDARLSFPSLHTSVTAFSAFFIAIYLHCVVPKVRVMRPFLSLSFIILSVMCGLERIGLYYSHWTDVLAGFLLGFFIAAYCGIFVLNNFREHMSSSKFYSRLKSFLVSQRLVELRDLYKENWDQLEHDLITSSYLTPGPGYVSPETSPSIGLLIPRPQVQHSSPLHTSDHSPTRATPERLPRKGASRIPNYTNTFQRDLNRAVDQYRSSQGYAGHM